MTPSTNHPAHIQLEQEVIAYLESWGFMTHSATYHETMPQAMVRILQTRFDPMALELRSRSDRVAVNMHIPLSFEYEVKTHANNRYGDLTIEALPLLKNIQRMAAGDGLYLYVFRVNTIEAGFWSYPAPVVRELRYPPRIEWMKHRTNIISRANAIWPNVKVIEQMTQNGSNDPFFIIDESTIAQMSDWKTIIYNKIVQVIA